MLSSHCRSVSTLHDYTLCTGTFNRVEDRPDVGKALTYVTTAEMNHTHDGCDLSSRQAPGSWGFFSAGIHMNRESQPTSRAGFNHLQFLMPGTEPMPLAVLYVGLPTGDVSKDGGGPQRDRKQSAK